MYKLILGLISISLFSSGFGQEPSATTLALPRLSAAPLKLEQRLNRIALGSCFAPQLEHAIWQAVRKAQPDLFLFIGDNVYSEQETPDIALPFLKQAYALLGEVKAFTKLRQSTPLMVTWDDHDYGMNDAGADWVARSQAEALFEYIWAVEDERAQRPGVYYARSFGPVGQRVQIIMLDTRYFRSALVPGEPKDKARYGKYAPSSDRDKTMLGDAQWSWLREQLRQIADLRFIVSSVAVTQDVHDMEGWRTLPAQRQQLYQLIADTGANGVIFLSGDRHFAGLFQDNQAGPYPITELMSSSMNLPIQGKLAERYQHESEPRRSSDAFMQANFGMIEIDWDNAQVELQVRDQQGRIVRSNRVAIATLSPAQTRSAD